MRFTDKEIVLYAIANAIRGIRDNDPSPYIFLMGTTDEEDHWIRMVKYVPGKVGYYGNVGGCVFKEANGRIYRQNYHQTMIDGDKSLEGLYTTSAQVQKSFMPLVYTALRYNEYQIELLAQQVRLGFVLDLKYQIEPYIEFSSAGWDKAYNFYRYATVDQLAEDKILNFKKR